MKRNVARTILVLVAISVIALSSWSCSQGSYAGKEESITIGSAPLESSALVYVAQDRHFFTENGLNVTLRDYDTGAAAHSALLKGEVDIAIPAEYPLVGSALKNETVRAIASIDKAQYFYLVGRKDRGIEDVSDLKGKKVGVVKKTIAEFYLARFLALRGIDIGQVILVDVNPAQAEKAIMNGEIDAIMSRPPYMNAIEKQLGANAVIWPAQSSQALYAIMIGGNDWITEHPDLVNRLLKSLAQAEEEVINYPVQAKAIVQQRLRLDDAYMATIWSQNQFSLSLDQSLILAMEDEARWMMSNNLTAGKQVPDFLKYIDEAGLKAVKPAAVNIIR